MKKLILVSLVMFLSFSFAAFSQVVKEKPKAPSKVVTKNDVEKPPTKANWVWVSGEWEWKSKSNEYKWVEAHWAKAPENKKVWKAGYWKKVKDGWRWETGRFE
jgi:hypothetical protein